MDDQAKGDSGIGVVHVELEIRIAARPERVWQALVEETGRWWHKDFYAGSSPQGFILEPKTQTSLTDGWRQLFNELKTYVEGPDQHG
jgi:uncharacterized protein YndB with AHSA1/START domain